MSMGAEQFINNNDLRNRDPWQVIREAAEQMHIKINKPNPSCKKCHGRGYTGRRHDTGEPLTCSCIFPKEEKAESERELGEVHYKPRNRAERRQKNKG